MGETACLRDMAWWLSRPGRVRRERHEDLSAKQWHRRKGGNITVKAIAREHLLDGSECFCAISFEGTGEPATSDEVTETVARAAASR